VSRLYTSVALCAETGATYRQVHYWTEQGWLRPIEVVGHADKGSGTRRIYDAREVAVAKALVWISSLDNVASGVRAALEGRTGYIGLGLELRRTPIEGKP